MSPNLPYCRFKSTFYDFSLFSVIYFWNFGNLIVIMKIKTILSPILEIWKKKLNKAEVKAVVVYLYCEISIVTQTNTVCISTGIRFNDISL